MDFFKELLTSYSLIKQRKFTLSLCEEEAGGTVAKPNPYREYAVDVQKAFDAALKGEDQTNQGNGKNLDFVAQKNKKENGDDELTGKVLISGSNLRQMSLFPAQFTNLIKQDTPGSKGYKLLAAWAGGEGGDSNSTTKTGDDDEALPPITPAEADALELERKKEESQLGEAYSEELDKFVGKIRDALCKIVETPRLWAGAEGVVFSWLGRTSGKMPNPNKKDGLPAGSRCDNASSAIRGNKNSLAAKLAQSRGQTPKKKYQVKYGETEGGKKKGYKYTTASPDTLEESAKRLSQILEIISKDGWANNRENREKISNWIVKTPRGILIKPKKNSSDGILFPTPKHEKGNDWLTDIVSFAEREMDAYYAAKNKDLDEENKEKPIKIPESSIIGLSSGDLNDVRGKVLEILDVVLSLAAQGKVDKAIEKVKEDVLPKYGSKLDEAFELYGAETGGIPMDVGGMEKAGLGKELHDLVGKMSVPAVMKKILKEHVRLGREGLVRRINAADEEVSVDVVGTKTGPGIKADTREYYKTKEGKRRALKSQGLTDDLLDRHINSSVTQIAVSKKNYIGDRDTKAGEGTAYSTIRFLTGEVSDEAEVIRKRGQDKVDDSFNNSKLGEKAKREAKEAYAKALEDLGKISKTFHNLRAANISPSYDGANLTPEEARKAAVHAVVNSWSAITSELEDFAEGEYTGLFLSHLDLQEAAKEDDSFSDVMEAAEKEAIASTIQNIESPEARAAVVGMMAYSHSAVVEETLVESQFLHTDQGRSRRILNDQNDLANGVLEAALGDPSNVSWSGYTFTISKEGIPMSKTNFERHHTEVAGEEKKATTRTTTHMMYSYLKTMAIRPEKAENSSKIYKLFKVQQTLMEELFKSIN